MKALGSVGFVAGLLAWACAGGSRTYAPNDPAVAPVTSQIVAFLNEYSSYGPDVAYQQLAPEVQATCSRAGFAQAMRDAALPATLRRVKKVRFKDGQAVVDMTLITMKGDLDQTWTLNNTATVWKVLALPGLENCKS